MTGIPVGTQAGFDAAIHQHALQRLQLGLLAVELAGQLVDAGIEGKRQGVSTESPTLASGPPTAGCLVEVELAVVQLADLGQPFTERVKAGRLGLQLAELDRQGVEIALGVLFAHVGELGVLGHHLLAQTLDVRQRPVPWAGHGQGDRRTDTGTDDDGGGADRRSVCGARANKRDPRFSAPSGRVTRV